MEQVATLIRPNATVRETEQQLACQQYAQMNGLIICKEYIRKLMEDAATGNFDTVLVYKMDRLYRQSMLKQQRPFRLISMLDGRNAPEQ